MQNTIKVQLTFFLLIFTLNIISQINSFEKEHYKENHIRFNDFIYKDNIKTVLFYPDGNELGMPIISLNSNEKLVLRFDDLDPDIKDYNYKLIHCTKDWEESGLFFSDFAEGFDDNAIQDYDASFNTFQKYTHYYLELPNNDISIKLSGNYLLLVYQDFDVEKPVLTRRFMVSEQKCFIETSIKKATNLEYRKSHQEIDFNLNCSFIPSDPFSNIKIVILQNSSWETSVSDLKPSFVRDRELIYNYEDENLFDGGSEYHHFNSKSFRFLNENIKDISFKKPHHYISLQNDEIRRFKIYFYKQDLNGSYKIDVEQANNPHLEADYAYVDFTLPYNAPLVNGNIYVFGQLSDRQCSRQNMMEYNFDKKAYTKRLYLKQGYYEYSYATIFDNDKKTDFAYIEGNHYETSNEYLILVYYYDISGRYDKLIGFKKINSINEMK